MNGFVIGYDLCMDFCQISCSMPGQLEPTDISIGEETDSFLVPMDICKKKGEDTWLIGEEAFHTALVGEGIMVDKLFRLLMKNGTATIDGHKYSALELMTIYIRKTLNIVFETCKVTTIDQIVFTVKEWNCHINELLLTCGNHLGISEDKIKIVSHEESYLYYMLSQKKELWNKGSALFDFTEDGMDYYEFDVLRGTTPCIAKTNRIPLEEGFSLDILEQMKGKVLGDTILLDCAKRLLDKKHISSISLSGRGFENCKEWANKSLIYLCEKGRVFFCQNIFAKGATYIAADLLRPISAYPYICLCEDRIDATISMQVTYKGEEKRLLLIKAGSNWKDTKVEVDFIPDNTEILQLEIQKAGEKEVKQIYIMLPEKKRPNKTTRNRLQIQFLSRNQMNLNILDLGFGELFSSNNEVKNEVIQI